MKTLLGDYEKKVTEIDTTLREAGIDISELSAMDHLCYRVETLEEYEEMLEKLSLVATLVGTSEVAGREIAVFELDEYLKAGEWIIPYIELPAPKASSPYPRGLEHAEIIVQGSLERFRKRHPQLKFETKALDKPINPELALKIGAVSVKFHEQSIGAVVRIEQRLSQL